MVTKENWATICQDVKNQCTFITKGFIIELDLKYFWCKLELMNVIGIIYFKYWVQ
jgi:hypothetical protein